MNTIDYINDALFIEKIKRDEDLERLITDDEEDD
jgi:hypothetical protein